MSRHRRTNFGRRAFAVAGPPAWNSLSEDTFKGIIIKDIPVCVILVHKAHSLEALHNVLYKFSTYLLTYFIKIQTSLTILVLAYRGCPGKKAAKWVSSYMF